MLSSKFILSCSIVVRLIGFGFAADLTYWTSDVADGKEGFSDTLAEIIWASGKLADAIKAGDKRLDGPIEWFFNVGVDGSTPKSYIESMCSFTTMLRVDADQEPSQQIHIVE